VVALQRVEDDLRLLRRRGVVEVDERLAVDLLAQDREVVADAADAEQRRWLLARARGRGRLNTHGASFACPSEGRCCVASRAVSRWSRSDSIWMRPMMSLAKA